VGEVSPIGEVSCYDYQSHRPTRLSSTQLASGAVVTLKTQLDKQVASLFAAVCDHSLHVTLSMQGISSEKNRTYTLK